MATQGEAPSNVYGFNERPGLMRAFADFGRKLGELSLNLPHKGE